MSGKMKNSFFSPLYLVDQQISVDLASFSLGFQELLRKLFSHALHNGFSVLKGPSSLSVGLAHLLARVAALSSMRLCAVT